MSVDPGSAPDGVARTEEAHDEEVAPKTGLAAVWEQVGTLVLAILIALLIRTAIVEPFRIPSGSMLPTLLIGDHLFVNKFLYGVRVPFTDWRLPGIREPERGDIVVFEIARGDGVSFPEIVPADYQPQLPRTDFVKRIVGLPGDTVRVDDGQLYINGEAVPTIITNEPFKDEYGRVLSRGYELLGPCRHDVLDDPRAPGLERSSYEVPPGRYFVMGDNRDYSNDSRKWGTVRLEEIKGPAFILYWSWDVNGNFLSFFDPRNWLYAEKRWGRIFRSVTCEEVGDGGS